MIILNEKDACCGCHACYQACPVQAIEMKLDAEGFLYPEVDEEKCIRCRKCQNVCPILQQPKAEDVQKAFACRAVETMERMSSSSGGFFAVLAKEVLEQGGCVWGAAFDEEFSVHHILIENESELQRIKGTKYVQSVIGNAYSKVKDELDQEKLVLFSGTPCQVAGLKSFLDYNYDNLLCADIICHGVPSPQVWKNYLSEKSGEKVVERVNFREKNQETGETTLFYRFTDGTECHEQKQESLYMKGFIHNLYLRPSCFRCKFKGVNRSSDLTMGDFWSAKEFHPSMEDGMGVSAVIVHSETGLEWMEKIKNRLDIEQATMQEIGLWNECLTKAVSPTERRSEFYKNWHEESLFSLIEKLTDRQNEGNPIKGESFVSRMKRKIKNLF